MQRSSFYYWQCHSGDRSKRDKASLDLVREVYEKSRGKAGIRQTKMRIKRKYGIKLNLKKIARLKREYNLEMKIRRKRKFYANLLKQLEHRTAKKRTKQMARVRRNTNAIIAGRGKVTLSSCGGEGEILTPFAKRS